MFFLAKGKIKKNLIDEKQKSPTYKKKLLNNSLSIFLSNFRINT